MRWFVFLSFVFLGTACTEPCLQLAYNVCQCQNTSFAVSQCKTNAQSSESRAQPNSQSQEICQQLLAGCNPTGPSDPLCGELGTPAGKEACGVAREVPDGGSGDGG
jgi:hypothetical protein